MAATSIATLAHLIPTVVGAPVSVKVDALVGIVRALLKGTLLFLFLFSELNYLFSPLLSLPSFSIFFFFFDPLRLISLVLVIRTSIENALLRLPEMNRSFSYPKIFLLFRFPFLPFFTITSHSSSSPCFAASHPRPFHLSVRALLWGRHLDCLWCSLLDHWHGFSIQSIKSIKWFISPSLCAISFLLFSLYLIFLATSPSWGSYGDSERQIRREAAPFPLVWFFYCSYWLSYAASL